MQIKAILIRHYRPRLDRNFLKKTEHIAVYMCSTWLFIQSSIVMSSKMSSKKFLNFKEYLKDDMLVRESRLMRLAATGLLAATTSAPLAAEKGRMPENPKDFLSFQIVDGQTAEEDRKDAQIRKEMYLRASLLRAGMKELDRELDREIKHYEAIENPTPEQKKSLEGARRMKSLKEKDFQMSMQKFADELDFLQRFRAKRAKGVEPITEEEMNTLKKLPKSRLTQGELKLLGDG